MGRIMKLRTITESSKYLYYVPMPGTEDEIYDMPDSSLGVRCWVDNPNSIKAMSGWLNNFVTFGELIKEGSWSLYQFVGPKPIALPFVYSLNYVDTNKADLLSKEDLKDYINWLVKTDPDSGMIINSAYEQKSDDEPFGHWTKGKTTHSELVQVISSIVKTLGPLVWSPNDSNPDMKYQIIATQSFIMTKINHESVVDKEEKPEILKNFSKYRPDAELIGKDDSDAGNWDEDEDWWKNA